MAARKLVDAQTGKPAGQTARHFVNRYDAAGRGRRMAGWVAPSTGPNRAITGDLQTLRNRASDSARNDWISEAIVQKWVTALVGIAITPRFGRIKSKKRKQVLADVWQDFVAYCDADGVLDAYGMQSLAVRGWLERGEVFARRRWRSPDVAARNGLPVPMQVQLLEADMVPLLDADTWAGLPVGHVIRSGIEFDRRGQRVAYWVCKEHPGDGRGAGSAGSHDVVRVPAQDMIHLYEPKRAGQRRGVPMLAPILAKLRNVADYEDATLERQKTANYFVAFVKKPVPDLDITDPPTDPMTGQKAELNDDMEPLMPMQPGLVQELLPGQDISFGNPPDAGTNYSDYMRTSHIGTTAGTGIPYELATGDIANVSDRTLRVSVNEFRRMAEARQWQIVIPQYCQKIVQWFADAVLLAGHISEAERKALVRCEHAPHGWAYIHPVQDVQGKALEVDNGFRSRSSVIAAGGDDPDVVDQERAEDWARERELGLWMPDTAQKAGATDDQDGIDDNEYDVPPNPAGPKVRPQDTKKSKGRDKP